MPLMPMLLNLLVLIPPRMPIGRSAFGNRSGSTPVGGSTHWYRAGEVPSLPY